MLSALSFTAPFALIGLLSLPAVYWLLRATPPRPQTVPFPGYRLLEKLNANREKPDKTPWPLILIRMMLVASVVIALAGPRLNAPENTGIGQAILVVVDNTYAAAPYWESRERALAMAAAQAKAVNKPVFVLETASRRTIAGPVPLTGDEINRRISAIEPQPRRADRLAAAATLTTLDAYDGDIDVWWLSDGIAGNDDPAFTEELRKIGPITLYADNNTQKMVIHRIESAGGAFSFALTRINASERVDGVARAVARNGRTLASQEFSFPAGEIQTTFTINLPLALRNEITMIRLDSNHSAGATYLVDARERRALVGIVSRNRNNAGQLLSGTHYIREALNGHAQTIEDRPAALIEANASAIILDDIAALREQDVTLLEDWIEGGGVLIRFAGPTLANAAQDQTPPLLPVALRGGGRAFGGALTWDTPQALDEFPIGSPFEGLSVSGDALIRQQILAQPGGETSERSWAQLADGTPLVTGQLRGNGVITLFHVSATPDWSDIPISGLFIDMLSRLVNLSAYQTNQTQSSERLYAPVRMLDAQGSFRDPDELDNAISLTADPTTVPWRAPGLYGSRNAPVAVNAFAPERDEFTPITVPGETPIAYTDATPRAFAGFFALLALALLVLDMAATLYFSGFRPKLLSAISNSAASIVMALFAITALSPTPGLAEQPTAPIDQKTLNGALTTQLAYVITGDEALDTLSEQAMMGLSRELYRRTALEPGTPAGIDLDTDDLSVYPFLYWPIRPDARPPSDVALANIENFMRFGGLILFDTRDDERATTPGSTPESAALQSILALLDVPPLQPVTSEHVLTRSFYLLPDLYGRARNNDVWVSASNANINDGVTPIIIGGRDWAGAWAVDALGRPMRPAGIAGERARELAYRSGVNMVMVALTGNYKSDQVHTPILLERLGR